MSPSPVRCEVAAEEDGTETRGSVVAYVGDVSAGVLDFVDYAGTTQIRLVYVEPDHRRQGIATTMIDALRAHFPASKPAQFYLNADGRALRDAIFDEYAEPRRP